MKIRNMSIRSKSIILATIPVLLLAACDDSPEDKVVDNGEDSNPRQTISLTRTQEEIRDSQNEFAFSLINNFAEVASGHNWVISPLSCFVNLSMISNGANDAIFGEFRRALHYPDNATADDINGYCRMMLEELPALDKLVDISVVNGNFLNEKCPLTDGYDEIMREYYNAPVQMVNLDYYGITDPNHPLNRWFSSNLPEGYDYKYVPMGDKICSVSPTIMHFYGKWETPFEKSRTENREFTNYNGEKTQVPTMNNFESYFHCNNAEFELVSLPYGNGAYSLRIFLPHGDLTQFLRNVTYEKINVRGLYKEILLFMPKFGVRNRNNLNGILGKMGFDKVLNPDNENNFSRFFTNTIGKGEFSIDSDVMINVDEDGTEAVAVIDSQIGGAIAGTPIKMCIDRPFFFMLEENSTHAVIAAGAVYELK